MDHRKNRGVTHTFTQMSCFVAKSAVGCTVLDSLQDIVMFLWDFMYMYIPTYHPVRASIND